MDRLAALTQQLDPLRPLRADENQLYVDWQADLMGPEDVKKQLVRTFARSGPTAVTRLFTGHRGTGKTTELYRVQRMLQEKKIFVSFLECEEWLDLNDVSPPDLVLQMCRQLVADLKQAGYSTAWDRVTAFFGELGEILNSDVELKEMKLAANFVDIGVAIKRVPGARAKLRKHLEDRLPRIYDLVNGEIIGPARQWLAKNGGFEDIVIIVDQLDRVPQKPVSGHVTNHEQLFVNSSGVLRSLDCDVLYTIPIELAYSHCHGRLAIEYGGEILTLPMITVPGRDDAGLNHLIEIVRRRAEAAGVALDALCSRDQLERICRLSGGHPRALFSLLRGALDRSDSLPLTPEIITHTVRKHASDFGKALSEQQWELLKKVHTDHKPLAGEQDQPRWMMFLRERYVYAYYDDGLWYDWNPLLAEIKR